MAALPEGRTLAGHLRATRYCDCAHPDVRRVAADVAAGAASERDAAVRLFDFVRDEVRYFFGPWAVRASRTLAQREGTCTNKANLLVALLRAAEIPAAYGVLRVDAQRYFGSLAPVPFASRARRHSTHVFAAAWLDGSWVRCDPTTDRDMAERTSHFCRQTTLVAWDGFHDAMDFLEPEHVHADLGLFDDIDELLDKPARNASPEFLARVNDYVRFIRSRPPFSSADDLIAAYARECGFTMPEAGVSEAAAARQS